MPDQPAESGSEGPGASRADPERGRADSRRRILDAAAAQFADHGFGGARTQAIADQAGVNKAMLYYHFRDKEALYTAALQDQFEEAVRTILPRFLDEELDPAERLRGVIRGYEEFFASHPHMRDMMLREIADGGVRIKEVLEAVKENIPGFGPSLLRARIQELMDRGHLREQDPGQVLLHLVSLAIFPHIARPILRALWDFDEEALDRILEERSRSIMDLFHNGLLSREEPS